MIPRQRLLIYGSLFALLPTLLVAFYLWSKASEIGEEQWRAEQLLHKVQERQSKQAINTATMAHFQDADNFYLPKQLQSLQFLSSEVAMLRKILGDRQFADEANLRKRLEFLTQGSNSLSFNEGAVVRYPLFREIIAQQDHPVEVDVHDILTLLRLIEGVAWEDIAPPPGRPQLIILDSKIDKKQQNNEYQAFNLTMRLLKREYL